MAESNSKITSVDRFYKYNKEFGSIRHFKTISDIKKLKN